GAAGCGIGCCPETVAGRISRQGRQVLGMAKPRRTAVPTCADRLEPDRYYKPVAQSGRKRPVALTGAESEQEGSGRRKTKSDRRHLCPADACDDDAAFGSAQSGNACIKPRSVVLQSAG